MDNQENKPIEPCRTTKRKKTPYGSASRNYYGELKKFRGYRRPIKKEEEQK